MQNAETYLTVVRARGRRRLPLADVYRQLFNPDLYLMAYGKLAANAGVMTPGTTGETVDGMSQQKIGRIIRLLRQERYRFAPTRRIYIEKPHSTKKRPLGIPPWSDKLIQEVVRLILAAYYEPRFSERSHGFRQGKGCQTALKEITRTWQGTVWFIEGDITGCFDSLDHEVLLNILRQDFHDGRFIRLLAGMLKAGYLEDWTYHRTLSGTPQGGVVSPILANIYLDRLDQWVENVLIPAYTRGETRAHNPAYRKLQVKTQRADRQGDRATRNTWRKQKTKLPSGDPTDATYRRLRYIRYADDFLLGFAGPRREAEDIKQQIGDFLRDTLKLELSETKTLITHGRTGVARFLGYDVTVIHADHRRTRRPNGVVARSVTARVGLKVPPEVVRGKCAPYLEHGHPIHRPERLNDDAFSIVAQYDQEYRGLVEYYRMAYNLHRFGRLRWVMETSLAKTLAAKHKTSVARVYRRYQTTIVTHRGPRKVFSIDRARAGRKPLVATWGKVDLARDANATLDDAPRPLRNRRTELVERLLADACELCGSQKNVEVHHIKALRTLDRPGRKEQPEWKRIMAARRRKTLVVCRDCHDTIHHGRLTRQPNRTTEYRRAL